MATRIAASRRLPEPQSLVVTYGGQPGFITGPRPALNRPVCPEAWGPATVADSVVPTLSRLSRICRRPCVSANRK
jgi:hypothetical protein